MPLPAPASRQELHHRQIDLRGYARADGQFDIEARMVDTKTEPVTPAGIRFIPAGAAIHDMSIRLVVDSDMVVTEVQASTDASPFEICPEATGALASITGLRIGPGWTRAVKERLGGRQGCTHLAELLGPLATVALQTQWKSRSQRSALRPADERPRKIDSCFAYAEDRAVVKVLWPQFYTGG